MTEPLLDASDGVAGVAFIPAPVQLLRGRPKLDDQVVGQVLRLKLTAFFAPCRSLYESFLQRYMGSV